MKIRELGFTLIEVLVSMTIGGLILTFSTIAVSQFYNTSARATKINRTNQVVHFALNRLIDRVRNSEITGCKDNQPLSHKLCFTDGTSFSLGIEKVDEKEKGFLQMNGAPLLKSPEFTISGGFSGGIFESEGFTGNPQTENDKQNFVKIHIILTEIGTKKELLNIKTGVSARNYKRTW